MLVYPLVTVFVWLGAALLYKAHKLYREGKHSGSKETRR
jgi:hypothetical protein